MATKPLFTFTHAEALAVLRLFGDAYKAGLRDAEWVNDMARCEEHISATREKGIYGRVTEPRHDSWREWKHRLLLMKDMRLANVRAVDLINRIDKPWRIEGCLLPLAQDFYNQGLKDWNDNPVSRVFNGLEIMRFPHWTRRGLRNRTFRQMWVDMQTFAFERGTDYEGAKSINSLTKRKFETFSLATWRALQEKSEREHILKEDNDGKRRGRPRKETV